MANENKSLRDYSSALQTQEPIDCPRWRHTSWPQPIRISFGLSPTQLHKII